MYKVKVDYVEKHTGRRISWEDKENHYCMEDVERTIEQISSQSKNAFIEYSEIKNIHYPYGKKHTDFVNYWRNANIIRTEETGFKVEHRIPKNSVPFLDETKANKLIRKTLGDDCEFKILQSNLHPETLMYSVVIEIDGIMYIYYISVDYRICHRWV